MTEKKFQLNTGAEIPAVGLGTWQSAPGEVKKAVAYALKTGYRHVDCAFCYANEDEVGEGLQTAFDTGNDIRFPKKLDGSRDLVLSWSHLQTWKQMEALVNTGKTRAIGVCNYSVRYLKELLQVATIVPAVNQIENHPYLPQNDIVKFCKGKGIHITAYSPLGSTGSPLANDPAIQALALRYEVPQSTILLSYHGARGSSVLAKSVTLSRIEQNKLTIDLAKADIAILEGIHEKSGALRYVYPPFGVDFGFPDKP
ncbi:hypothetical protein H2200_003198 [Cladophialophora chaetospira]|uniref:D-xylose reductase [NAD(P)H] n=1 Tax=Cladophialophora chaetospira TaxID=386627 RepID=A0AA38XH40_9EURO|nr:hypothetical protein H2200_003198 [Cladophialophora chaetospira]